MESASNDHSTSGASRSIRILVVDDDPLVREALVDFLEQRDWEVSTATSGEEALEQMTEQRDLDLVLLDVHLPGLDGFEVLERSQAAGVIAPVIMISTSAGDSNELRAHGLGAEDYLTKPLDPDALAARVETVLGLDVPADAPVEGPYQIGAATIDLEAARLYRPDAEAEPIPQIQRDLLRTLLRQRGQVVSRKRLLKEGLRVDEEAITFSFTLRGLYRLLELQIDEVRRLIEPNPRRPVHLERVYGQGYRLRA